MPQGLAEGADTVNFAKFLAALRALKFRYKFREILICPNRSVGDSGSGDVCVASRCACETVARLVACLLGPLRVWP